MQAGGRRFDPVQLHQLRGSEAGEGVQSPEASGTRVYIVLFASGLLNQCYRLFFNNTEEVKQSCPTGEGGGASLLSRAWGGMGWIVSSPLFPEGGNGG